MLTGSQINSPQNQSKGSPLSYPVAVQRAMSIKPVHGPGSFARGTLSFALLQLIRLEGLYKSALIDLSSIHLVALRMAWFRPTWTRSFQPG